MKTLHLTLKKKWFDMILSGEKKEEYRDIKPYWEKRLMGSFIAFSKGNKSLVSQKAYYKFDAVRFKNGYAKDAPVITVECKGIETGYAIPEWSDNWKGEVFIIKLGEIITVNK